jgi:hypothetical protein
VAEALRRQDVPHFLPLHDTVEDASTTSWPAPPT